METLKEKLNKYQLPEKTDQGKIAPWQDYAIKVCSDFGIKNIKQTVIDKNGKERTYLKNYRAMIFRHAKNNLQFLKGKVENAKEKFGTEGINDKGNYLISLFRKNAPWIKK
jgi:hypothetical protein